ncbi:Histone-like transcription factor (CBF/NF-Y) and archaeal histone [Carpediemonas membranifera]|uniref:Histone-like transcription factor (CBF/NF-Y) and archaeal histone n=1 Tax=Carpediemonas membranifera TaxID=201153 RepID=A0A8J6AX92_9EUKA|nr:Histone-like transcription factor (CBF/NF-Y) and archaeal histone [Carpediemonas membranifera]|eukprot:KAG9396418.1 Histone-like transcription factor (CBF/NF-Y) and archaeal histone [Carpediemonas membranifera]
MAKRAGTTKKKRGPPRGMKPVALRDNATPIEQFIHGRMEGIEQTTNLKQCLKFPAARIKSIMRADPHVRMISADATAIVSKAAELFVLEVTKRALDRLGEDRKCLMQTDIIDSLRDDESFDFLVDLFRPDRPPVAPK